MGLLYYIEEDEGGRKRSVEQEHRGRVWLKWSIMELQAMTRLQVTCVKAYVIMAFLTLYSPWLHAIFFIYIALNC